MHVCYNDDLLEEVVDSHDCITEHEEALRHTQHIFQRPFCLGLEIFDAVISYVANRTAGERRKT